MGAAYMELYIKVSCIDKYQNVQYYGVYARLNGVKCEIDMDSDAFELAKMALPDEAILFADFITKKEFSQEFAVHGISS
jgi:hypothetical protein